MKKKILFILEDSRISGISIHTLSLVNFLNYNNINCNLILPKKNSYYLKTLLKKNKVRFKYFNLPRISKNFVELLKYSFLFFFAVYRLINYVVTNKFDIVVLQGSTQIVGLFASYFLRKNFIMIIHDSYSNPFQKFLINILRNKKIQFVFVSYESYQFYKNIIKESKFKIINNGIDIDKYIPKKIYYRKKKIIGTVCNINPEKNLELLVDTASYFKDRKDITFLIAGSIFDSQKKYYNEITKMITKKNLKNIKFCGFYKNVEDFLKQVDVYFCFSKYESSPLSVWEAMASGKPIITTNVGDLNYHLKKKKFGILVNSHDGKSCSNAIKKIIYDTKDFKVYSKNARNYAKKNFNKDLNYKKYIKLLINN